MSNMNIYSDVQKGKQKPNFVSFQNIPANALNSNSNLKKITTVINQIKKKFLKNYRNSDK